MMQSKGFYHTIITIKVWKEKCFEPDLGAIFLVDYVHNYNIKQDLTDPNNCSTKEIIISSTKIYFRIESSQIVYIRNNFDGVEQAGSQR